MKTAFNIAFLAVLVLVNVAPASATPATRCEVVNLMPEFWRFWDSSQGMKQEERVARFKAEIVAKHPELYSKDVLAGMDLAKFDHYVAQGFDTVAKYEPKMRKLSAQIQDDLPKYQKDFKRLFPDYKCSSTPIYFYFPVGAFDGGTRPVNGKTTLLFGLDTIARTREPQDMKAFFGHELFHIYHSDLLGEQPETLYWDLWEEGLATYVSHVFSPKSSESGILGTPIDLAQRTRPLLPKIVPQLIANLGSTDEKIVQKPFLYNQSADLPPRYGYYVGYRVVQRVAQKHSLQAMTRLKGEELENEIRSALESLDPR